LLTSCVTAAAIIAAVPIAGKVAAGMWGYHCRVAHDPQSSVLFVCGQYRDAAGVS